MTLDGLEQNQSGKSNNEIRVPFLDIRIPLVVSVAGECE